ncbi:MAG: glycerol kinase GlpK [Gammaproteobacteria bacterium]|nr:glycerol kinase GlpK [Gammaproteobacteria bacterium]
MTHILALDQGTTSSRAIVFELSGRIAGIAHQELEQNYPQAGWVEHDPRAIIETQMSVALAAIKQAGVTARDIAAIGITNQRETTVLWDRRSGDPVANAIVWQDRRTADLCASLRDSGAEDLVRAKTGLVIDPYFSASKIRWMLDHIDGVRDRAERGELAFGTVDSWLIWHLSEGRRHVTDATNASRTMLYDIRSGEWDEELLALWKIPRSLLPEVCDTSGVSAMTTRFGGELPVAGIAGDQQAALFGQACFEPGMAKCTYGTGCFILMATGGVAPVSERGLLTTIAGRSNGVTEYALEGSVFMGGATVQWLRDGLGLIEEAADIEALAREVDNSDGVVLVPAFTGLGAPQWDPHARALLIGMTRGTTRAHIARAALEGIAWQVVDVADAMAADAGVDLRELRVDGGASANGLLMQNQSDFLGVAIVRPHSVECTAHGAALLAGLGVGLFKNRRDIADNWQAEVRFKPRLSVDERNARHSQWTRAVEKSRNWTSGISE